jgi:hypothetical protein
MHTDIHIGKYIKKEIVEIRRKKDTKEKRNKNEREQILYEDKIKRASKGNRKSEKKAEWKDSRRK